MIDVYSRRTGFAISYCYSRSYICRCCDGGPNNRNFSIRVETTTDLNGVDTYYHV